ncbi:hypothetical protein EYF80_053340 [Liparis tanakae]|uniref:Uncharacterized protein n=1 Tax=Liparis tanakae TaxID=230148 RepID=A0A4Z2F5V2_9TELE|nr:hypothetical protein EYF80_053340 [Liparis tanakae]
METKGGVRAEAVETKGGVMMEAVETKGGVMMEAVETKGGVMVEAVETKGGVMVEAVETKGGVMVEAVETKGGVMVEAVETKGGVMMEALRGERGELEESWTCECPWTTTKRRDSPTRDSKDYKDAQHHDKDSNDCKDAEVFLLSHCSIRLAAPPVAQTGSRRVGVSGQASGAKLADSEVHKRNKSRINLPRLLHLSSEAQQPEKNVSFY